MLVGTETLLTYDVKLEFKDKPVNLKFYSDSSNNQELVVENNTYLALNGFMSLSDEKKREIPVYWVWELETGESAQEIEDNDAIDTEYVGKTMSMQIAVTGTQVTSNPYANAVASTTINGRITVYDTVQAAIEATGQNQGAVITLLRDNIDEAVSIANTQNVVLNTNGKTITSNTMTIINRGILMIVGTGTISSDSNNAISNYNRLDVKNGNIRGGIAIDNKTGNVNISGGNVIGNSYGVLNENNGIIEISGNANIEAESNGIVNGGNTSHQNARITIISGKVRAENYGVANFADGQIVLGYNDGVINTNSPEIISGNIGIRVHQSGSCIFYDGIIKVPTSGTFFLDNYNIPAGYQVVNGTEIIEGQEYITAYLEKEQ